MGSKSPEGTSRMGQRERRRGGVGGGGVRVGEGEAGREGDRIGQGGLEEVGVGLTCRRIRRASGSGAEEHLQGWGSSGRPVRPSSRQPDPPGEPG